METQLWPGVGGWKDWTTTFSGLQSEGRAGPSPRVRPGSSWGMNRSSPCCSNLGEVTPHSPPAAGTPVPLSVLALSGALIKPHSQCVCNVTTSHDASACLQEEAGSSHSFHTSLKMTSSGYGHQEAVTVDVRVIPPALNFLRLQDKSESSGFYSKVYHHPPPSLHFSLSTCLPFSGIQSCRKRCSSDTKLQPLSLQ